MTPRPLFLFILFYFILARACCTVVVSTCHGRRSSYALPTPFHTRAIGWGTLHTFVQSPPTTSLQREQLSYGRARLGQRMGKQRREKLHDPIPWAPYNEPRGLTRRRIERCAVRILHEYHDAPLSRSCRVLCNTVQSGIGSSIRFDRMRGPSKVSTTIVGLTSRWFYFIWGSPDDVMLSYHRFLSRDTIHVVSELHVDSL